MTATPILDTDPDAVQLLRTRLADMEAKRDRIKAYNASCRKAAKTGGTGDTQLLDAPLRADLVSMCRTSSYNIGPGGSLPAWLLTNLGGNIKRYKDRLARLERLAAVTA